MSSTRYCAAGLECGCLVTCGHSHESVGEAVACIRTAGAYVVAVHFGTMRSLNQLEEGQFQSAIHNSRRLTIIADAPAVASYESIDSRYAIMTRIRVGDQWTWTTWMCFATYAEAAAHAREGDKVVRFRSAEWHELWRKTTIRAPSHECAHPDHSPIPQDEILVETVLHLLDACGFEQRPAGPLTAQRNSTAQEGVQQDEIEENAA